MKDVDTPGIPESSLSLELGFWIPIAFGIPDSLSCIPDSKAQDSRFNKQKFPAPRNPLLGRSFLTTSCKI